MFVLNPSGASRSVQTFSCRFSQLTNLHYYIPKAQVSNNWDFSWFFLMLAATRQDGPWRLLPSIFHPIHHHSRPSLKPVTTQVYSYDAWLVFWKSVFEPKEGDEYCDWNFVWFFSVPPNNPRLAKGSLYKMWGHGFDPWDFHSWPKCQPCCKAYFTNGLSYFWGTLFEFLKLKRPDGGQFIAPKSHSFNCRHKTPVYH